MSPVSGVVSPLSALSSPLASEHRARDDGSNASLAGALHPGIAAVPPGKLVVKKGPHARDTPNAASWALYGVDAEDTLRCSSPATRAKRIAQRARVHDATGGLQHADDAPAADRRGSASGGGKPRQTMAVAGEQTTEDGLVTLIPAQLQRSCSAAAADAEPAVLTYTAGWRPVSVRGGRSSQLRYDNEVAEWTGDKPNDFVQRWTTTPGERVVPESALTRALRRAREHVSTPAAARSDVDHQADGTTDESAAGARVEKAGDRTGADARVEGRAASAEAAAKAAADAAAQREMRRRRLPGLATKRGILPAAALSSVLLESDAPEPTPPAAAAVPADERGTTAADELSLHVAAARAGSPLRGKSRRGDPRAALREAAAPAAAAAGGPSRGVAVVGKKRHGRPPSRSGLVETPVGLPSTAQVSDWGWATGNAADVVETLASKASRSSPERADGHDGRSSPDQPSPSRRGRRRSSATVSSAEGEEARRRPVVATPPLRARDGARDRPGAGAEQAYEERLRKERDEAAKAQLLVRKRGALDSWRNDDAAPRNPARRTAAAPAAVYGDVSLRGAAKVLLVPARGRVGHTVAEPIASTGGLPRPLGSPMRAASPLKSSTDFPAVAGSTSVVAAQLRHSLRVARRDVRARAIRNAEADSLRVGVGGGGPDDGRVDSLWGVSFSGAAGAPTLATSAHSGVVRCWELSSSMKLSNFRTLRGHNWPCYCVAYSPPVGDFLASAGNDGVIRLFDVLADRYCCKWKVELEVGSLAWSPEDEPLLASTSERTVCIWDKRARDGSACVARLGQRAAGAAATGRATVRPAGSGKVHSSVSAAHDRQLKAVEWMHDCQTVVTGDVAGVMRLFDMRKPDACLTALAGHTTAINCLKVNPLDSGGPQPGRWLASASDDRTVRVWDVARCRCVTVFGAGERDLDVLGEAPLLAGSYHSTSERGIEAVAWSPNGAQLAIAAPAEPWSDDVALVVDVQTGARSATLRAPSEAAENTTNGLDWLPGCEVGRLATVSRDGVLRVWVVPAGARDKVVVNADLMESVRVKGGGSSESEHEPGGSEGSSSSSSRSSSSDSSSDSSSESGDSDDEAPLRDADDGE